MTTFVDSFTKILKTVGKSKVSDLVSALRSAIAADEKMKVAKRMTAKPKPKKKTAAPVGKPFEGGKQRAGGKKAKPVAKM